MIRERKYIRWVGCAGLCVATIIAGCTGKKTTRSDFALGGINGSLVVAENNYRELGQATAMFLASAEPIVAALDKSNPESEIAKINRAGSTARLKLSRPTFRLLDMTRQYSAMTGYAYDYTAAPLYDLRARGEPEAKAIDELLNRTGMRYVETSDAGSIALTGSGVQLDVGDLAIAYAMDCGMVELRRRLKGPHYVLLDGQSRRDGAFPAGQEPLVAITHFDGQRNVKIGNVKLAHHAAVVSRSLYRKNPAEKGEIYPMLDPRTGRPASGTDHVTVAGPLTTTSFVLAEALLVLGRERGARVLASFPGYDALLLSSRDAAGVWLTPGMEKVVTLAEGFTTRVWDVVPQTANETAPPEG